MGIGEDGAEDLAKAAAKASAPGQARQAIIRFSEYPIIITIRDYDSDKGREETVAREIFGVLCGQGYSLLLVFGLQKLLDTCGQ